jgi:hypothetical protein
MTHVLQSRVFLRKLYECIQYCKSVCYGSSLGSNPDISQNYKMGDLSKGVANTVYPAKKNYGG